jgi:flavorubredoxin
VGLETYLVCDDTWLLALGPRPPHVRALLVAGREPLLVDPGPAAYAAPLLAAVARVLPVDRIRHVFVTAESAEVAGALPAVAARCPAARMLAAPETARRLPNVADDRLVAVPPGSPVDLGDRSVVPVPPPIAEPPSACGLFDTRTGVYWAGTAFGADVAPIEGADTGEHELRDALAAYATGRAPWLRLVDPVRWQAEVERVHGMGVDVIASSRGPLLRGDAVETAFDVLRAAADPADALR